MELINITPFPPFYFSNIDQLDREFHILIFRGTFKLRNGKPIVPVQDQIPVAASDVFYEDDIDASVLMESQVVPFKPRADFLVTGEAYSPSGKPEAGWIARAKIGKLAKSVRVLGPRRWRKSALGWYLEASKPTDRVPLLYELAFGGIWRSEDGEVDCFESNPVGCGYIPKAARRDAEEFQAPQLEYPGQPVADINKSLPPAGFGPVGRAWKPRRELVGTTDDEWLQEDFPGLPWDFDFGFYNCAPEDQIYPGFLRGDERFELLGLHRDGVIHSSLPGLAIGARINRQLVTRGYLDTVSIDTATDIVTLVWRATFRTDEEIEHIEARYVELDQVIAA